MKFERGKRGKRRAGRCLKCWAKLPGPKYLTCPDCRQKNARESREHYWRQRAKEGLTPAQGRCLDVMAASPKRWWRASQVAAKLYPGETLAWQINLFRNTAKLILRLVAQGLVDKRIKAGKAIRRPVFYRMTDAGMALWKERHGRQVEDRMDRSHLEPGGGMPEDQPRMPALLRRTGGEAASSGLHPDHPEA